jgi:hypothetical protein
MHNATRPVIQKDNEIMKRFLTWRQWIDQLNISISGHPNLVGDKSISVFHFVIEQCMDGGYDFDIRPRHSNSMMDQS